MWPTLPGGGMLTLAESTDVKTLNLELGSMDIWYLQRVEAVSCPDDMAS